MPLLHYRAGPGARVLLRHSGLSAETLRVVVGTATGPRWLGLVGLDRALIESDLLGGSTDKLLVGASAGAWRSLALAFPDPISKHRDLVDRYIGQSFSRGVGATEVSSAYRKMLAEIFPQSEVSDLLGSSSKQVALHACRALGPMGSRTRWLQLLSFMIAAGLTAISAPASKLFLERILFHSQSPPARNDTSAKTIALTENNLHDAALASGTVPLYMDPIDSPDGAPDGRYIDGGMADYHLRQLYHPAGEGITLLFHFQEELRPTWFDKRRSGRRPSLETLDPVLLVYADPSWIESLPSGALPDRQDFLDLADRPKERQSQWRETVKRSEELGKAFLEDLHDGRISDLARAI